MLCRYCKTEIQNPTRQQVVCKSPECRRRRMRDYYHDNKDKCYKREKTQYYESPRRRNYVNTYIQERSKRDPAFAIRRTIRGRFHSALKTQGLHKNKQIRLYGINVQEIINHLGPCPGKRRDYHIDHIIPLSRFDLSKDSEVQKAFAPTNHQWLTVAENIRKNNKI